MAETAPNKTVNSAGMRPAAIVGQSLAPAPAHRVKKILETYNMTAGGSIHGPTSSQDEISSYSKFYPSYHHHQVEKIKQVVKGTGKSGIAIFAWGFLEKRFKFKISN